VWFVHHHCIYCDSRSEYYGIDGFDKEILVKVNAIDLLRDELSRRRFKGVIGLGAMAFFSNGTKSRIIGFIF